jgi:hypothetical protein
MARGTSTIGRAFEPSARVESLDVRTLLLVFVALAGLAPEQAGQPINAMCPVKPKQKSKATITVTYEGQVIGFC